MISLKKRNHSSSGAKAPQKTSCARLSRHNRAYEALACQSEAGKGRHKLVTGRFPAGSFDERFVNEKFSKSFKACESFTGYPPYTTAFSPSRKCRVFVDNGEPVPQRKKIDVKKTFAEDEPWKVGRITYEDDNTIIIPEDSRRLYREWIDDPDRTFHPNAFHNPEICPNCFASLDCCICKNDDSKKTGLARSSLGSYRLIDTTGERGYST